MRPVANENCRNKGSLSLIRKIAVKGIAVKVCSLSMANLVHVITNSIEWFKTNECLTSVRD